jgi:hypothetical protein
MKSLKRLENNGMNYEIGSVKYNTKGFLICGPASKKISPELQSI